MEQLNKNVKIMKNLIGIFILFVASGCATSGSNLSYYIPELDDGEVARGNPYTAGDEFKEFLKDIPSDLIDDVIRGDF